MSNVSFADLQGKTLIGQERSPMTVLLHCPRCKRRTLDPDNYGESGIYRSCHRICVPCWHDENAETDREGNDRPATLAGYGPPNDFD